MKTPNHSILGYLIAWISTLAILATPSTSISQSVDRNKIIVSYTYNFAKNIRWPNEQQARDFKIGLYQVQNPGLANEFLKLNNGTKLKNVPIKVKKARSIRSLAQYDLIFVESTNDKTISQIQSSIEGKPILLVTSKYTNKRLVMINLFETQNQRLQFEVNKANIINNGLKPLPELILLGGTEIDVAALYREGQNSLVKLQKSLSHQQEKLNNLQEKVVSQEKNNARLTRQTQKLNKDIAKTQTINLQMKQELKNLNDTITKSKDIIKQQKQEIVISENQKTKLIEQVKKRNEELDLKKQKLQKRQKELELISQTISEKEAKLTELNKTIEHQESLLNDQKNSIKELDHLVNAQKQALYFLWGLVAAGMALFSIAILAYRIKRRDNQRLAKRGQELQTARDKLDIAKRKAEAANRAKGAFLSLMSHELRTPLQSIIGYTDIIIESLKMEGNTTYVDQLTRVNTNGERLLELINNTLDLAKIEAGKMKVQLTPVHLNALIDDAVGNVKPLLNKNNNKLNIVIDNNTLTPQADYDKLLLMLVNLLSNATKFTKNGVITITIKNSIKELIIIVSDTGVGLDKEQLEGIFDQFNQANYGNTRKFKGTGLGLSITQHFCEIMGGKIHAESEKDKGTDFIINIPLPVVINEKKFIGIEEDEKSIVT